MWVRIGHSPNGPFQLILPRRKKNQFTSQDAIKILARVQKFPIYIQNTNFIKTKNKTILRVERQTFSVRPIT